MTTASPSVWHVRVPRFSSIIDVKGIADSHAWEVEEISCVRLASGRGRILDLVPRTDAVRLYEEMHRRPVAVVYEGKPRVRLDPAGGLRDDRTVSLYRFCRYKSFPASLRSNSAACWDSAFEDWLAQVECDGSNDPRILPFHIFATKGDYMLDELAERQRFRREHHNRLVLVDKRKRRWRLAPPGARHGREPQTVRGQQLYDGFHWDVTAPGTAVVTASDTIWRVGSGGYINIYPDGHVRRGKQCTLTWSKSRSEQADVNDRIRSRP